MQDSLPLLLLAAPFFLASCTTMECAWGTHLEGRVCIPGAAATVDGPLDTGDLSGPHPLAPEEYQWIWNTDGCTTEHGGATGHQVYMHLYEAESTASGDFSGMEHVYWFFAEKGWAQDCVDTFEIEGTWIQENYSTFGAAVADEGWYIRRTLVESQCGMSYRWMLSSCKVGDGYCSAAFLDTITPSGNPNIDNKFLVFTVDQDKDGGYSGNLDENWGKGHIYPENEAQNYGPPATYDWVGEYCQRAY